MGYSEIFSTLFPNVLPSMFPKPVSIPLKQQNRRGLENLERPEYDRKIKYYTVDDDEIDKIKESFIYLQYPYSNVDKYDNNARYLYLTTYRYSRIFYNMKWSEDKFHEDYRFMKRRKFIECTYIPDHISIIQNWALKNNIGIKKPDLNFGKNKYLSLDIKYSDFVNKYVKKYFVKSCNCKKPLFRVIVEIKDDNKMEKEYTYTVNKPPEEGINLDKKGYILLFYKGNSEEDKDKKMERYNEKYVGDDIKIQKYKNENKNENENENKNENENENENKDKNEGENNHKIYDYLMCMPISRRYKTKQNLMKLSGGAINDNDNELSRRSSKRSSKRRSSKKRSSRRSSRRKSSRKSSRRSSRRKSSKRN